MEWGSVVASHPRADSPSGEARPGVSTSLVGCAAQEIPHGAQRLESGLSGLCRGRCGLRPRPTDVEASIYRQITIRKSSRRKTPKWIRTDNCLTRHFGGSRLSVESSLIDPKSNSGLIMANCRRFADSFRTRAHHGFLCIRGLSTPCGWCSGCPACCTISK